MLLSLRNVRWMPAFLVALIHLFSSFGELNGIELPLELLHEGVSGGNSMEFARRINFPLPKSDNGVELPPTVENDVALNTPQAFAGTGIEDNDNLADDLPIKSAMPKWLQMQIQQQPKAHQHTNYHHPNMLLPKHTQSGKHHSVGRQVHSSATSSAAATSTLRRCSIEISSNIPGVCQAMGSIGTACVSGDYVDVFNAECL